MHRRELERSWAITREHLAEAKAALLSALPRPEGSAMFAAYEDYLDHNELELALDELESIAENVKANAIFWRDALSAAESMGLVRHAERYRHQLQERR
jgi:hypothetical protein